MRAVLVWAAGLTTVAVSVSVALAAPASVPTAHRPVPLSYEPRPGTADTNWSPAGSKSVTATPVAASGPLLGSVTVNVTVSPTLGVGFLTDFLSARSACCGFSVALPLLLVGTGSNWSLWARVAVLVSGPGLSTRAVSVSVCAADGSIAPTSHSPVAAVYVPRLGLAASRVSPAGSRSVTRTPGGGAGARSGGVTV